MKLETPSMRPFRLEDIKVVAPESALRGREAMLVDYGTIFTFEKDGQPVACAGLVKMWPGVAEAWTVLSDVAKANPLWIVRQLRCAIREQAWVMQLHRVQMHVEDDPHLLHWGRCLGFRCEGTMEKYTSDQKTMHIMALMGDAISG
jgi:hypothetical protein